MVIFSVIYMKWKGISHNKLRFHVDPPQQSLISKGLLKLFVQLCPLCIKEKRY